MGHKVFVSYKYADDNVWILGTARDYVDMLCDYIKSTTEHIYKGENDGEDLSNLSDETIWKKLKDKIYDSTLTIVMISPGMKESKPDRDQWIPWEISYSLKETSRKNKNGDPITSRSNAMLAIVLPDSSGSYSYYTHKKSCCSSGCRVLKTDILFDVLRNNMFNIKNPNKENCSDGSTVYHGESSYIDSIKWEDFIKAPEKYINQAYVRQDNIALYNITKEV